MLIVSKRAPGVNLTMLWGAFCIENGIINIKYISCTVLSSHARFKFLQVLQDPKLVDILQSPNIMELIRSLKEDPEKAQR